MSIDEMPASTADEAPTAEDVAEWAVLGTAVQSSEGAAAALAQLVPAHFFRNAHRIVFEAVQKLAGEGEPVDPSTVLSELARAGMLAKVGRRGFGTGGVFLHSLIERAGSVGFHAPIVRAAALRRNLAAALESCAQITAHPDFDPAIDLEHVRKLIEDATAFAETASLRPNSETVVEVLDALEHGTDPGLPTGYPDLDDAIGGLRPGELVVIGARPGNGKSLLSLCIADYIGTRVGVPVLFSSLEMTETELTLRRISATAKVPLDRLARHQVSEREWDQISRAHARLTDTKLFIDDTSGVPLAHIRGQLRAMARTGDPARLLVIDYLGFMGAPRAESRQQAVADIVRSVKKTAREFEIPVILLCQLNRGSEHRADRRPVSSDLRESGESEQTADIVMLLHREDAYEPESPKAGDLEVIITKNRQGPRCTVTLHFQGHYGRVVSFTDREPTPSWTPHSNLGDGK